MRRRWATPSRTRVSRKEVTPTRERRRNLVSHANLTGDDNGTGADSSVFLTSRSIAGVHWDIDCVTKTKAPLAGGNVTIDGQTLPRDANGQVGFNANLGSTLQVSVPGYEGKSLFGSDEELFEPSSEITLPSASDSAVYINGWVLIGSSCNVQTCDTGFFRPGTNGESPITCQGGVPAGVVPVGLRLPGRPRLLPANLRPRAVEVERDALAASRATREPAVVAGRTRPRVVARSRRRLLPGPARPTA